MLSPRGVGPIQETVPAKPHRPVYRMHRYFARRPYSVFAGLLSHYTHPNDLVLDPFCGGGVTLVEGILQGRRVVGFDINPLAVLITRMELELVDVERLKNAISAVREEFQSLNSALFTTKCRRCEKTVAADWFEHSALVACAGCGNTFTIASAKKAGVGRWECPHCHTPRRFSFEAATQTSLIGVCYWCPSCQQRRTDDPTDSDLTRALRFDDALREAEGLA